MAITLSHSERNANLSQIIQKEQKIQVEAIMRLIPFAILGKSIRGNPLTVFILKFEVKIFQFAATELCGSQ